MSRDIADTGLGCGDGPESGSDGSEVVGGVVGWFVGVGDRAVR